MTEKWKILSGNRGVKRVAMQFCNDIEKPSKRTSLLIFLKKIKNPDILSFIFKIFKIPL